MKRSFSLLLCLVILVAGCNTSTTSRESSSNRAIASQEKNKRFDYQPRKPQNGKLLAVIELGSLGLNYFIINKDSEGSWALEKADYGRSNFIYGVNSNEEIRNTVQSYKNEIMSFGVSEENIHLVASSSVIESEDVSSLNEVLNPTRLTIVGINAQQEAQYALLATVPKEFIEESFMVDIGSGNTKLSWVDEGDTLGIETYGSKYFLNDVQDTTVFREVRDAVLSVPAKNRTLCFMLGGMVYEITKDKVSKDGERYIVLETPNTYPVDNEKLKAANIIYNALYLEPTYSYIFDKDSNFSIGYLLSL